MDNQEIARIFEEISDLLKIKGANPFKIRAYRNAAETLVSIPERLSDMDDNSLRAIPGIGKDLASRIRELSNTGTSTYHTELLQEYPASLLELLKLQGLGPKTVGLLHSSLGIKSIEELENAGHAGRLGELRGLGPKKQELILEAINERRRRAGKHLITNAQTTATAVIDHLRATCLSGRFHAVGSLRRGCDTCGDVDILTVDINPAVHDSFIAFSEVDRVLGHGETKSSILLRDGIQVDLRLVSGESEGAALQYFTGSKSFTSPAMWHG